MRGLILAVAAALMLVWAPAASAQQSDLITGTWGGSITWQAGDVTDDVAWTFAEDGTFTTNDGFHGIWSQYNGHVTWIIDEFPRSVYEMAVNGDSMTGHMINMEGIEGDVSLTRQGRTRPRGGKR